MMNFPRLVLWSGRQPVTLALLLVGLWLLCMIFVPIANWVWGAAALRSLIVLRTAARCSRIALAVP